MPAICVEAYCNIGISLFEKGLTICIEIINFVFTGGKVKRIGLVLIVIFATTAIFGQGMENISKSKSTDLGLKRVGLRLGLVIPSAVYDPAFAASGNIDFGEIIPQLGLSGEVDFWRSGADIPDNPGDRRHYMCLGGGITLSWRPDFDLKIKPYIGAGLGAYYYKPTYPENYDTDEPADFNPFELHFELGGDYPINEKYTATAAFRANISNISSYFILVGMRMDLGK